MGLGGGGGSHAHLGAAPCFYAIVPKFTFATIISYSALGIGLYVFYRNENYCSIQKRTKKVGYHTCYEKIKNYLPGKPRP